MLECMLVEHERVAAALVPEALRTALGPTTYTGLAPRIVDGMLAQARASGWLN